MLVTVDGHAEVHDWPFVRSKIATLEVVTRIEPIIAVQLRELVGVKSPGIRESLHGAFHRPNALVENGGLRIVLLTARTDDRQRRELVDDVT